MDFIFEAPARAIDTRNINFHALLFGAPTWTFDTTNAATETVKLKLSFKWD